SIPEFVKVSPTSTINFAGSANIPVGTYGNMVLSGTDVKSFAAGDIHVLGNLRVGEGLPLRGASQNGTKVHLSGNLIFQGPREQPPADNTVDLLLTGAQHTITAASDFHLFRLTAAADATVAIN